MKKVLVTGANGQLAQCIKDAAHQFPNIRTTFVSRNELDITDPDAVLRHFKENTYDYCINTAAYTHVEKAESDRDEAIRINAEGVAFLVSACNDSNTTLIHISTDYVFDGEQETPYVETDTVNPLNVYGASKLKGEMVITSQSKAYFIFRTSWLYSQYGHNFLNSMIRLAKEGKALSITTEQTGTPTNANDLAEALLAVITSDSEDFGIYHFSNGGETTWYGFAKEIFEQAEIENAKLAQTDHYRTFAKRPRYSVMDSDKAVKTFDLKIKHWKESLKQLIENKLTRK